MRNSNEWSPEESGPQPDAFHFGRDIFAILNPEHTAERGFLDTRPMDYESDGAHDAEPAGVIDAQATHIYRRLQTARKKLEGAGLTEAQKNTETIRIAQYVARLKEMEIHGYIPMKESATDEDLLLTRELLSSYLTQCHSQNLDRDTKRVDATLTLLNDEVERRIRMKEIAQLHSKLPTLTGDAKIVAQNRLFDLTVSEAGVEFHDSKSGALAEREDADIAHNDTLILLNKQ